MLAFLACCQGHLWASRPHIRGEGLGCLEAVALVSRSTSSHGTTVHGTRKALDSKSLVDLSAVRGPLRSVPGTFVMGSPVSEDGRDTDEAQHTVTLRQERHRVHSLGRSGQVHPRLSVQRSGLPPHPQCSSVSSKPRHRQGPKTHAASIGLGCLVEACEALDLFS